MGNSRTVDIRADNNGREYLTRLSNHAVIRAHLHRTLSRCRSGAECPMAILIVFRRLPYFSAADKCNDDHG